MTFRVVAILLSLGAAALLMMNPDATQAFRGFQGGVHARHHAGAAHRHHVAQATRGHSWHGISGSRGVAGTLATSRKPTGSKTLVRNGQLTTGAY
jgi:hypothetical protein